MAIVKFTNSNHGLKGILRYITQYAKTEAKLISGKDCMPESALDEMQTVKRMFGKETGRQYIHLIQSFSPEEKLTHAAAHEIGAKLAARFEGFQAIIATHKDRGHIHNHIIINSVNMDTGRKWQQSQKQMQAVKEFSDSLCLERGLTVITEKSHGKEISRNELKAAEKGQSWKFKLMNAIDGAMSAGTNKGDFIANMEQMGYGVQWMDTHKYITYTTPEGQKCRDNRLHEEKYLKVEMEKFYEFRQIESLEQAGQTVGTAGKSVRGIQPENSVLRNPAGSVEHIGFDDNRNRKVPSAHAGKNLGTTDMDGLVNADTAGDQPSHEQPHTSGQSVRKQLKKGIRRSDGYGDGGRGEIGQRQTFQIGANASSAGQHADQTPLAVDRHRRIDTGAVIGAVVALENLLAVNDQPKDEKKYIPKPERRHQQKKKHSSLDRQQEWEMEL